MTTNDGLGKTIHLLAHTDNESAVAVLAVGLSAREPEIRQAAIQGLLTRREETAHRHVLRCWPAFDDHCKSIAAGYPGRLFKPIRDFLVNGNRHSAEIACDVARWTAEYDLVPVLIQVAEDSDHPAVEVAARTVLQMAEKLAEELDGPRDYRERRDPQLIRARLVPSLETALARFNEHGRQELVEAFLLLCQNGAPNVKRILQDTSDARHRPVLHALRTSRCSGVTRLLVGFLEDAHAPLSTIILFAVRTDEDFLKALFARLAGPISPAIAKNLRRITTTDWLDMDPVWLDKLDDRGQQGAAKFMAASAVPRKAAFRVISHVAVDGTAGGRRAAIEALAEFPGAEANRLVLNALDDNAPQVQAEAVAQLRQRGTPGALATVIELLDSPHEAVREKARESLTEFEFTRFQGAFDLLDEDVQRSTGELVRKTDLGAIERLAREMEAAHYERRRRALSMAVAMNVTRQLQSQIIRLLDDPDQFVRAEAARSLENCTSSDVRAGLRRALLDPSPHVRVAAETSLQAIAPQLITDPSPLSGKIPAPFAAAPSYADDGRPPLSSEAQEVV